MNHKGSGSVERVCLTFLQNYNKNKKLFLRKGLNFRQNHSK